VTAVLTDTEVVVLLDEHIEIPCDGPSCDTSARWSIRCGGCSVVGLACDRHKTGTDHNAERLGKKRCKFCHYIYPLPLPFLPL